MPTVPYKPYASVQPSATPPEDYFHLQVSPGTFGGHIAQGLEKAGQGMEKAADTWGEVQKDNVLNQAIKDAEAATEDYSKLNGMEAVNAEQGAKDRLDQIAEHYRGQLPPNLAHQFDTAFRPYQYRLLNGKISTHAITQTKDVAKQTNEATGQRAGDLAAANYNNPEAVDAAMHTARDATIKQIHIEGNDNVPDIANQAIKNSDSYVLGRAAEAMFVHNAPEGAAFVEKNRVALGARYTPLAEKFRARATEISAEQKSDVLRRIYQEPDPVVRQGLVDANRAILGEAANTVPGAKTNVVPLKPKEPESDALLRRAREQVEGKPAQTSAPVAKPTERLPGESREDWLKRHGAANSSPVQNLSAAEQSMENTPAQRAITTAANINYTPNPGATAEAHAAPVRTNNPGAQWPNKIADAYGSTGHEDLRDGNKIAKSPTPIHGAAANMALLADKYVGMTIRSIQSTWSGQHRESLPGYPSNMRVTAEMMHNHDFMVTFMKNMAEAEAKGGSTVLNDQQWQQAFDLYQQIGNGQVKTAAQ